MMHQSQTLLAGVSVYHFDLSYWAFEKLAHPVYGLQMVDFKAVSCLTSEPLQFLPGDAQWLPIHTHSRTYRIGVVDVAQW